MDVEIGKISSAIVDLDKVIESHIKKIELIRDDTINRTKKEYSNLDKLTQQNLKDSKRNEELNSEFLRLNVGIKESENKVMFLESRLKSMDVDESKISELKNKIAELNTSKDKFTSEIEIIKTDKSIVLLEIQEINDNIISLKSEYESISKQNSKIKNEFIDTTNKILVANSKLKHINTEVSVSENELNKYNLKLSDAKGKLDTINDKIIESEERFSNTECKNQNELDKVKKIREEIAELNKIKDNITHEIENAKKKSRSDENRILAIKKDVLRFIMESRDIGNKKKISEFTRRIENA